jgi:hypothetical protein
MIEQDDWAEVLVRFLFKRNEVKVEQALFGTMLQSRRYAE